MPRNRTLTLLVLFLFFSFASEATACNLEKKTQEYIDKIYSSSSTHYGTKKPLISYNTSTLKKSGKNEYRAGRSDSITITLYQRTFDRFFGKQCTESHWKELKVVVAHEYGHHIDLNHGKSITALLGTSDMERAAIVGGEHILYVDAWGKKSPRAKTLKKSEKAKYSEIKKYIESL
jgi:hypothetical protein